MFSKVAGCGLLAMALISVSCSARAASKDAAKSLSQLRYRFEFGNKMNFWQATFALYGLNTLNVVAGFIFLGIAKANFRTRIFR